MHVLQYRDLAELSEAQIDAVYQSVLAMETGEGLAQRNDSIG